MIDTPSQIVYRRHRDASFQSFGTEMLVVVPREAWQIVLNGTGLQAMQLVDGRRSVMDIALELSKEYCGVPAEQIAADVTEMLRDLEQKGAVERTATAG